MKKIEIVIANPTGNITIFVKTPVDQEDYQKIASFLFSKVEFNAEQIAFVHDWGQDFTNLPEMHMAGMEFCGNATRSFALLIAKEHPERYQDRFLIKVSGATDPLSVNVDTETNNAQVFMPLDFKTSIFHIDTQPFFQVSFEGITHLIAFDIPFRMETFEEIKTTFYRQSSQPAFGIMFVNRLEMSFTPVVFVRDINTTFVENSCASGTAAVAIALSESMEYGAETFTFTQPGGVLSTTITKKDNQITNLSLEGPVSFSKSIIIDIE